MPQKISLKSNWSEILSEFSSNRPDGDGWETATEVARALGIKENTARHRLQMAVAAGRVQRVRKANRDFYRKITK